MSGLLPGESGFGLDIDIDAATDDINNINSDIFDLEKGQAGPETAEQLAELKRAKERKEHERRDLWHKRELQRHPPSTGTAPPPAAAPPAGSSAVGTPTPATGLARGGGTVLEVVDGAGHPLSSIAKDTPFWVRVRNPARPASAGAGDASGIAQVGAGSVTSNAQLTVQVQVGSSVSTVTLTGVPDDPMTFVSQPITLGGPVGVPVEGVASEPVTVTFAGGSGNVVVTGDAFRTSIQQAWQATTDTVSLYDAYWRQIAIGLRDLPITPKTDPAVALLKKKSVDAILVLDRAHAWLRDPNELTSTQVAMAQVCLDELRTNLVNFDPRAFEGLLTQQRTERIRDENNVIYWRGLSELAVGFYELVFSQIPFLSSTFALVTGTSITGAEADRLSAVGDLALQAAGSVAARQFRVMDNVARRAPKMGRVRVAKLPTGKEPSRGIREGTAVRAEGHGMLPHIARQVNFIAEEEQVFIEARGTNTGALADRATGHPGKPAALKPKTINELDILLGANPEAQGHAWVGYFEPKLPARTPGMSDATWSELNARFNERMVESVDCKLKMAHLEHEGLIRIDQGVVIDTGLCGGTGKAITGDYDLWRIANRDGTALSPEKLERVLSKLRRGDFHAEHGCHTDWVIDETKMSAEDFTTAKRVDAGVRAKHAPGKDSLIVFRGYSRPTIAVYEPAGPGPHVRTPLIPDGLHPGIAPSMPGATSAWFTPGLVPRWLPPLPESAPKASAALTPTDGPKAAVPTPPSAAPSAPAGTVAPPRATPVSGSRDGIAPVSTVSLTQPPVPLAGQSVGASRAGLISALPFGGLAAALFVIGIVATAGAGPFAAATPAAVGPATAANASPATVAIAPSQTSQSRVATGYLAVSTGSGSSQIMKFNLDGTGGQALTKGPVNHYGPSVSPDGTQVLFTGEEGSTYEIYRMNIDGSNLMPITMAPTVASGASWAPDGKAIIYAGTVGKAPDFQIVIANPDGTGARPLTNSIGSSSSSPVFSPDGSTIAFGVVGKVVTQPAPGGGTITSRLTQIWTMKPDGSGAAALTAGPLDGYPSWITNSAMLFARMDPAGKSSQIFKAGLDGTVVAQTPATGYVTEPSANPDGKTFSATELSGTAFHPSLWSLDTPSATAQGKPINIGGDGFSMTWISKPRAAGVVSLPGAANGSTPAADGSTPGGVPWPGVLFAAAVAAAVAAVVVATKKPKKSGKRGNCRPQALVVEKADTAWWRTRAALDAAEAAWDATRAAVFKAHTEQQRWLSVNDGWGRPGSVPPMKEGSGITMRQIVRTAEVGTRDEPVAPGTLTAATAENVKDVTGGGRQMSQGEAQRALDDANGALAEAEAADKAARAAVEKATAAHGASVSACATARAAYNACEAALDAA